MSESSSPIDSLIGTPRKIVDRTIETQESINRQGLDLTRQAVRPIAGVVPVSGDAEEQVDDAFDRVDEQQSQLLEGVQEVADRTFETSEDAAEWGYDLVDRQVGRLQRAGDSAGDTAEDALESAGETAERTLESAEDVAGDLSEELDEAADEFEAFDSLEDTAVEGLVEDGIETISDLASAQADAVADAADTSEDAAEELIEAAVDHEGESLADLEGIGETYADRLAADGIRTVDELARTSADEVADVTEVREERAAEWVQQAQDEA